MSGKAEPAGAPAAAAAAGWPDRSSTLGAPEAGLGAAATTTIAHDRLRECTPPPPPSCRPAAPSLSRVVAESDWPAPRDARGSSPPIGPTGPPGAGPGRAAWRPRSPAEGAGGLFGSGDPRDSARGLRGPPGGPEAGVASSTNDCLP